MRTLTTTELNHISGGNHTEEHTTVIVNQDPILAILLFRDLTFLLADIAFRILIESSYEYDFDDEYYYYNGIECY